MCYILTFMQTKELCTDMFASPFLRFVSASVHACLNVPILISPWVYISYIPTNNYASLEAGTSIPLQRKWIHKTRWLHL